MNSLKFVVYDEKTFQIYIFMYYVIKQNTYCMKIKIVLIFNIYGHQIIVIINLFYLLLFPVATNLNFIAIH